MRSFFLACLITVIVDPNFVLAADKPKAAVKFTKRAGVEITKTERLLNLDKDFTIEILAKWQPSTIYLATDEVWPTMSDQLKVTETAGWALRTKFEGEKETLNFTVATQEKQWISLSAAIPLKRPEWNHIAVCRKKDTLILYFNGVSIGQSQLGDLTLVKSPTPLYLGVRAHAMENRLMNGYIAKFAVAQTFRFPQGPKSALLFKNDKKTLLLLTPDEQETGIVNDATGNGHLGVLRDAEIVSIE